MQSWRQIVSHVNGLAVASSLAALHRSGWLTALPLRVSELPGNQGYLQGLFRALDSLGWVDIIDGVAAWTSAGKAVVAEADLLTIVPEFLETFSPVCSVPVVAQSPVTEMLQGHQAAPVMLAGTGGPLLEELGWWQDGDWTAEGRTARAQSSVYEYPVAYLPLLRRVEELLFLDCAWLRGGVEEVHIDRGQDIRYSGKVFAHSVGPVFWELFLPAVAERPAFILDVGCGDGTMLAELGARAPGVPLVGVELNSVAREAAAARVPLVVEGDIGNPDALAEALSSHGLRLRDGLVVTKSVVHNRSFREPRVVREGRTTSRCADVSGAPISAGALEGSLVEFFQAWKPHLGKHGFLMVEAHCVPPAVARANQGRTLAPALELLHCYSGQLLVEASVHRACAAEAGLVSRGSRELGAQTFGHHHMTVDHFV